MRALPPAWASILKRTLTAFLALGLFLAAMRTMPRLDHLALEVPFHATNPGEALLHQTPPQVGMENYHLPMGSILCALLFGHAPPETLRPWLIAARSLALLLILALGCLAASLPHALAALALPQLLSLLPHGNGHLVSWYGQDMDYFMSFFSLLITLVAALSVWRARSPSALRSLVLGSAVGASLLFRSTLVLFPVFLALCEWLLMRRDQNRPTAKSLAILCATPFLFLLPWIWMNWSVHHRFIPLEDGEANRIIVPGALGFVDKVEHNWRSLIDEPLDDKRPGGVLVWAVREVLEHPGRYARAYLLRLRHVFLLNPFLFLLAALSLFRHRRRREIWPLGALAVYFVGIHCCMSVWSAYFQPLWPLLAVLGALGLAPSWLGSGTSQTNPERRFSGAILGAGTGLALAFSAFTIRTAVAYGRRAQHGPATIAERLDEAVAASPDCAWLLFERAKWRLGAGSAGEALADLNRSLALRPDHPERERVRIWCLLLNGESAPFLAWTSSPQASRDIADDSLLAAYGYLKLGRPDQARRRLESGLRGADAAGLPEKPCRQAQVFIDKLHSSSDYLLTRSRPPREHLRFAGMLADLAPECGGVWIERARWALEAGDRRRTLEFLARARKNEAALGPEVESLRLRATALDNATAFAQAAGVLRPLSAAGRMISQADAAAKAGDRALALRSLDEARRLRPNGGDWQRIASLYQALGRCDVSLQILDRLTRENSESASLYSDRGVCRHLLGRPQEAAADLWKAVSLEPRWLPPYVSLGAVYIQMGRFAQALETYDRGLRAADRADPLREELRRGRDFVASRMAPSREDAP